MRASTIRIAIGIMFGILGVAACSTPPPAQTAQTATPATGAAAIDRTVLPIAEPNYPRAKELDARNAKPPARFEVKAPPGAPNVIIFLIDDIGFGHPSNTWWCWTPSTVQYCSLFNLGRYDEAMKMADLAMSLRPTAGTALSRWARAHVHYDPREAALREDAVKHAPPESVLQTDQNLAIWDGRLQDVAAIHGKLVEFYRANKREEALASAQANELVGRAIMVGGAAMDELRKAISAPGAPRGFVEQAAIVLAVIGDASVARRELPRAEREPIPAGSSSPRPIVVAMRAYVLAADGKFDDAIAAVQTILSDDVRQASTYFNLGQIQERAGRKDDAIASYRRLVDAAPALATGQTLPWGRLALASLLAAKGDTAGANVQLEILRKQWARADAEFLPAQELKKLSR